MNDPARQASPLLTRLAGRPVASSLLRSTLSGLSPTGSQQTDNYSITPSPTQLMSQPSTQTVPTTDFALVQQQPVLSRTTTEDVVDDDTKLALFDSVLDEFSPQVSLDTIPTNVASAHLTTSAQPLDVDAATLIDDTSNGILKQVQDDRQKAQPDPLVSMMSQSMPSDQFLADTFNISPAPTSSRRAPESVPFAVPTAEMPGISYVEQEPNNFEIPVEVEGFLERVADHTDKLPQEIVIQGDNIALNQAQPIKKAVIMLPITEEDEEKAKGKNPTWSIAWLVSWSQKIIKKFTGQVVYSHTPTQFANT